MRQGAFRLACAVQAVVLAVGGVVALTRESGHHAPVAVTKMATRPAAGRSNKDRARQEAAWLLSLTRVPDGARPTSHPPRLLSGPIIGTPAVSSLVIRSSSWWVPMSYSATLAWLQAHPPRGLTLSSSGGGVEGPDGSASGYGYSDVPVAGLQSADLEVGVTADGNGSAIRADAVVVWLDPKPVRDTATGTRLHVIVDGNCPSSDRGVVGVRNDGHRLGDRLLPAARPTRGLLCRYNGGNGAALQLLKQTRMNAAQAESLADAIRRLPLSHVDGGVVNCPMDDGAAAVVALSYADATDVDVWVQLSGCAYVSNGEIVASAGSVPELVTQTR